MRTPARFLRPTAALLLLAALAACSSSKKDDPTASPAPGMSWTADGVTQTTTTLQSQGHSPVISVAGTVLNGSSSIYLYLAVPNAVGTYTFNPTADAAANYTVSIGGAPGTAYYAGATGIGTLTGAGTIIVTALTATNVQGTFTFTGINAKTGDAKSVSNGTFNVGL